MRPYPLVFATVAAVTLTGTAQAGWYDAGWQNRVELTLNGGLVPAGQTNFPVLVAWTANASLAASAQTSGNDILFTAADGTTKLAHEIESYNSGTGALAAWVNVPALASGSNTTIYLYYGNATAGSQQNRPGVWDANFQGVWHLAESPADGVAGHVDSTSNGFTGTPQGFADGIAGSTNAVGVAAGSDDFFTDTYNSPPGNLVNRVEVPDNVALRPNGDLTVEAWANLYSSGTGQFLVYKLAGPSFAYQLLLGFSNTFLFERWNTGATGPQVQGTTNPVPGTWYHVAGVVSGGNLLIYVNGSLENTVGGVTGNIYVGTPQELVIGATYWGAGGLDGREDEVRISNVARSATWIQTEYNNLTNQGVGAGKFILALGAAEAPPSGIARRCFGYRKPITIDSAQVAGPTNLLNFPVLVSLPSDGDLQAHVATAQGWDIGFTAEDNTTCGGTGPCTLDHEIEQWDPGTGTLVAWVRIPVLDTTNPTVLHVNYGDAAATAPKVRAQAVWDDGYLGVWHLGEVGTGVLDEYKDSSRLGNHGRGGNGSPLDGTSPTPLNVGLDKFVPTRTPGRIGYGQDFSSGAAPGDSGTLTRPTDGYFDLIDVGSDITLDPTGTQITLQAWIRHNITAAFGGYPGFFTHKGYDTGYRFGLWDAGSPNRLSLGLPNTTNNLLGSTQVSNNVWHQVVATFDGVNTRIYLDGVVDATGSKTSELIAANAEGAIWLGHADQPKDKDWSNPWAWIGQLDEMRISRVARSGDWIATEWNNQRAGSTFLGVAPEEGAGGQSYCTADLAIDYRSVGVNAGVLYGAGTATVAVGATTVTFTGSLPVNVGMGDRIILEPGTGNEETLFVFTRDSTSQATVQVGAQIAHSGTAFEIRRAYNTLQAWEDDRDGDLVAENRREFGVVYNDGPLTGTLTIDGSTTDSERYMHLKVAAGSIHDGTAATGARLDPSVAGHAITVLDDYSRVDWLEIVGWEGAGNSAIRVGAYDVSFNGLLVHEPVAANCDGFSMAPGGDWLATVRNTIVYSTTRAGFQILNPTGSSRPVFRLDNVTIYNAGIGSTSSLAGGISLCEGPTSRARAQARGVISVGSVDGDGDGDADFNIGGFADGCYVTNTGIANVNAGNTNATFSPPLPNDVAAGDRLTIDPSGTPEVFTIVNRNSSGTSATVSPAATITHTNDLFRIERGSQRYAWWDKDSGGSLERGASSNNMASSGTPAAPGLNPQSAPASLEALFVSAVGPDLHLETAGHLALDAGADLGSLFCCDIDSALRPYGAAWDIGADEAGATTAVALQSFEATPLDSAVDLTWRTASELDNLGFHLYRGLSETGPWERITLSLIPGLGSSPEGASYSFLDTGLVNGVRYSYRLEDIDSRSGSTFHGPVSAVPGSPAPGEEEPGDGDGSEGSDDGSPTEETPEEGVSTKAYGDPEATSWRLVSRTRRGVEVELWTGGFYATSGPEGLHLSVPGFDQRTDPQAPDLPLKRVVLDAVVGRRGRIVSVKEDETLSYGGLIPAAVGEAEIQTLPDGTMRPHRRASSLEAEGVVPQSVAWIAGDGFLGETKKLALELSPLRYDTSTQTLLLTRRLRVKVVFDGASSVEEKGVGSRGRRRPRSVPESAASQVTPQVLAHLHTLGRGLYGVSFESVFPQGHEAVSLDSLRLSLQGEAVPFHVEPERRPFGPGSVLYFYASVEAASTDFTSEVAYALEESGGGIQMGVVRSSPRRSQGAVSVSLGQARFETNRYYQAGLLDASDVWLWDYLLGGMTKSLSVPLAGVDGASSEAAQVRVVFQGASESGVEGEHHLRVWMNGTSLGETSFEGKRPHIFTAEVEPSVLLEGENSLTVEDVGDGGAYSFLFVDRVEVVYPQTLSLRGGVFEGAFVEGGEALVEGEARVGVEVLEGGSAVWLGGVLRPRSGRVRVSVESGPRYVLASEEGVKSPRVSSPVRSSLRSAENQADYILVAPEAFLESAGPLLQKRQDEGLRTKAVSLEEIASEFGYGRASARAIRDFLAYAYHTWQAPSVRYVLLLGDASYDPRNFSGIDQGAPLPALWAKTSYMWTSSDPALGAVNGEDLLPDVAVGRVPAKTAEEARALVEKVLAWEAGGQDLGGLVVLVADNPDKAGDFEANVEDIRSSFLGGRETKTLLVSELGRGTRGPILDSLNAGASLLSYVGHGGPAVWASENVLNSWDTASLVAQSRQPLMLTFNCLNGYFVAPNYDSLAEAFVKAEGRGTIGAFSPSGLSLDGPAHQFHRALMEEITRGGHERLGDAVLAAEADYAETGLMPELLAIYHLLADPGMKIR
ncbi:MAG: DUF2341 domain-containing protein [Acidobacteria bacterium]|nr:DUF2341 domain-containing protein [Acidobacteriota bacterium]